MVNYELGKEGEAQARVILKNLGYEVQSPDWLGLKDDEFTCFEVKKKERFTAGFGCNFDGHGLDSRQIYLREKLFLKTGIRTYLMIFEVPIGLVFGQWLDILEGGKKYITKNRIVIYPLESFENLKSLITCPKNWEG